MAEEYTTKNYILIFKETGSITLRFWERKKLQVSKWIDLEACCLQFNIQPKRFQRFQIFKTQLYFTFSQMFYLIISISIIPIFRPTELFEL